MSTDSGIQDLKIYNYRKKTLDKIPFEYFHYSYRDQKFITSGSFNGLSSGYSTLFNTHKINRSSTNFVFKYSTRYGRPLFYDKTRDLLGEELRAVVIEHIPAIIRLNDTHAQYTGVEAEMLLALSKAMNFTIAYYEPPNGDRDKWGNLQPNGTMTGLLGEMIDAAADYALGDLYYTQYHLELMDLSVPYYTQCLTFITPEFLSDNSWKTLILPFSPDMWEGVGISLLCVGMIFFLFSKLYAYAFKRADSKSGPAVDTSNVLEQSKGIRERVHQWKDGWKEMSVRQAVRDRMLAVWQKWKRPEVKKQVAVARKKVAIKNSDDWDCNFDSRCLYEETYGTGAATGCFREFLELYIPNVQHVAGGLVAQVAHHLVGASAHGLVLHILHSRGERVPGQYDGHPGQSIAQVGIAILLEPERNAKVSLNHL